MAGMGRGLTRRDVLKLGVSAAGTALFAPSAFAETKNSTTFGIIADVHHGLGNRTEERLAEFVEVSGRRELSFIAQLGDFNHPQRAARPFLDIWTQYRGSRYGVLGNHDMDYGFKEDAIEWWQIPDRFYSYDAGHLHFVVMDANNIFDNGKYVPYGESNYFANLQNASMVDEEQLDWLVEDLSRTSKQTVILIHQAIDEIESGGGCLNRHRVRAILEEANRRSGFRKVIAVFAGHQHRDQHEYRRGIHYVRVNSASYYWVGDSYGRTCDYEKPLYCFVTVNEGSIVIEGRDGTWTPPTPSDRKFPGAENLSPKILDRQLRIARA